MLHRGREDTVAGEVTRESPIACVLTALDPTQRKRHQDLLREMRGARGEVRKLADGLAFIFPYRDSLFLKISEWITLERRCCPFIAFSLELKQEGGPIVLRLTGREGVKQFLREELGLAP